MILFGANQQILYDCSVTQITLLLWKHHIWPTNRGQAIQFSQYHPLWLHLVSGTFWPPSKLCRTTNLPLQIFRVLYLFWQYILIGLFILVFVYKYYTFEWIGCNHVSLGFKRTKFFSQYTPDSYQGEASWLPTLGSQCFPNYMSISHLQPAIVNILELLESNEIDMLSRGHTEGSCWVHHFVFSILGDVRLFVQFSSCKLWSQSDHEQVRSVKILASHECDNGRRPEVVI